MNIIFTPTAWKQYTEWFSEDKKMIKRINELIKDIDRNGLMNGIGKPEPLKHRKACSRPQQSSFLSYNTGIGFILIFLLVKMGYELLPYCKHWTAFG